MTDNTTYRAASKRQFIERVERLSADKKDIAAQQTAVLAEAKGRGYEVHQYHGKNGWLPYRSVGGAA
jgi:uncharacterized protein (UPF0335 family)